jgi:hypothetical protein
MPGALASELLLRCNQARDAGEDFPTIWNNVMRKHPAVLGQPVQVMVGSEPQLKVKLTNGQNLTFRAGRFYLS